MARRTIAATRRAVTRHAVSPIETSYKGYRFRSRLEARWAMFYDLCGVPWTHEPQPLLIDGEGYLPDFEIESLGFRVLHEVKPLSDAARILADDQTRELRMIRQAAESADGGAITFGDPLAIATTEGRSARFGDAGIAVWYICGRHIREAQIVRAHRFEHGGR